VADNNDQISTNVNTFKKIQHNYEIFYRSLTKAGAKAFLALLHITRLTECASPPSVPTSCSEIIIMFPSLNSTYP